MRFFFPAIFFLASCGDAGVPKGVLPPAKTEAVLYDIIRADEWADFAVVQDSTFRHFSKRGALYDTVFQLHGITKEQYRQTMRFYQNRPDLLKDMLANLKTRSDTAIARKQPVDTLKKIRLQ